MAKPLPRWATCFIEKPTQVVENGITYLEADVYNHPRFEDGTRVRTSRVVTVYGEWPSRVWSCQLGIYQERNLLTR